MLKDGTDQTFLYYQLKNEHALRACREREKLNKASWEILVQNSFRIN